MYCTLLFHSVSYYVLTIDFILRICWRSSVESLSLKSYREISVSRFSSNSSVLQGGSITCDSLVKTLSEIIQMTAIYPKSSEFLNLHTVSDTLEVMKPSSGNFKLESCWELYLLTKLVLTCKPPNESKPLQMLQMKAYRWLDLLGTEIKLSF